MVTPVFIPKTVFPSKPENYLHFKSAPLLRNVLRYEEILRNVVSLRKVELLRHGEFLGIANGYVMNIYVMEGLRNESLT